MSESTALGTFSSQRQFTNWLALRLDERGLQVSVRDDDSYSQAPEWTRVIDLTPDNGFLSTEIRPGLHEESGEQNLWVWYVGLGPSKA